MTMQMNSRMETNPKPVCKYYGDAGYIFSGWSKMQSLIFNTLLKLILFIKQTEHTEAE